MRVEVLCATMNQNDFSKLQEMNISCDVVFANQAGRAAYDEIKFSEYRARMITTNTVGVGRNRNIGLIHASGDILLFADDDVRYADDLRERVLRAYEEHPEADMIIFSMDITKNGQVIRKVRNKDKRIGLFSALKYGTYTFSARRSSVERGNLWFSSMFGGGTKYAYGEDTLFLIDAFRKGLRVYTSSYCLGTCSKEDSTCFHGYDERYFFDRGVLYACAFGMFAFSFATRYCIKKRSLYRSKISVKAALNSMRKGINHYRCERNL
ncbi:MAG: glycosyltransferase family 2 protein [Christensenellaceae bacterium]|nr:glycosyltransferase family 2 protein [Christensenellaceae bacterium]